jgi:hypothetical protein
MAWYNVLLRRQRYPFELATLLEDFELANIQGKWLGIFTKSVENRLSAHTHTLWFNNGRWETLTPGYVDVPQRWKVTKMGNVALVMNRQFAGKNEMRQFVEDIVMEDIEFYIVSTDLNGEFSQGHAWQGVVSRGNIEFDDYGPIQHLIREE